MPFPFLPDNPDPKKPQSIGEKIIAGKVRREFYDMVAAMLKARATSLVHLYAREDFLMITPPSSPANRGTKEIKYHVLKHRREDQSGG